MDYVIVPGIGNSGDAHWQTLWEAGWGPRATRIAPVSWDAPDLEDWCGALSAAATRSGPQTVLVAHSLGCLAVTEWLTRAPRAVLGAFLVAPPDPQGAAFPAQAAPSFLTLTPRPLTVPAVAVISEDDPYCAPAAAYQLAGQWEVPVVAIGAFGHVNADSGVGDWRTGHDLLTAFTAGLGPLPVSA
jgi:uncharacterized protein